MCGLHCLLSFHIKDAWIILNEPAYAYKSRECPDGLRKRAVSPESYLLILIKYVNIGIKISSPHE